jgi:hypothetical protein
VAVDGPLRHASVLRGVQNTYPDGRYRLAANAHIDRLQRLSATFAAALAGADRRGAVADAGGDRHRRAADESDPAATEAGLQLDRNERRWVQEALNGLGFEVGTADGFGRPYAGGDPTLAGLGRPHGEWLSGWTGLQGAAGAVARSCPRRGTRRRSNRKWYRSAAAVLDGEPAGEDGRDNEERRHEVRVGISVWDGPR